MRMPVVLGLIERRLLVNYRIDADVMARQLPSPFRPQLAPDGSAVAGICLIRLAHIRLPLIPDGLGLRSENAAHRIAVAWDSPSGVQEGVFIPRRDTSSSVNVLVGGRLFPGVHHRAHFQVVEDVQRYRVEFRSVDGAVHVLVDASRGSSLPAGSVFASVAAASAFFERGSLGYSAIREPGVFDGLELRSCEWRVEPLEVTAVTSSYFEDATIFPPGSVRFDSALLMRNIAHEWHARAPLRGGLTAGANLA